MNLSISLFTNTPSSFTTGLNSQSTLHLSAITFLAIPPEIPPICKVVYGGLNTEFSGFLFFKTSLNCISF